MKILVETIDGDKYLEIILSDFDLDLLDEERLISKDIKLNKQKYNFCVRKQTQEEKYAIEER